ncbi:MAG: O-antigen ligase family protein [Rhabdochlamydiaceae bacterium]
MGLIQQVYAGDSVAASVAMPARLPVRTQWLIGAGVAVFLLLSFLLAQSLVPIALVLGVAACWMMLRTPLASILGFMGINVLITLMPREQGLGGAPTGVDLALGGALVIIMGYWFFRIRVVERQPISGSASQLSLMLFFPWAVLVTIIGIVAEHNPADVAIREILNLLPLLILPVLYERYIIPGSKDENWLIGTILGSGVLIVFENVLLIRNHLVQAYYLYEVGKATVDLSLAAFLIVMLFSFLMLEKHTWKVVASTIMLLAEALAVVLSITRNAYISVAVALMIIWLLGNRQERKRGIQRISIVGAIAAAGILVAAISSRLISLLLKSYWLRLLSTQKLGHDLSLRMRFAEWSGEWAAIKHSPLLGHGFGASFKVFDIVLQHHVWQPFSHNSYLYIIFKTGFIGALLFLTPFFAFMFKAFKLSRLRSLPGRTRIGVRGCFGCMVLLLFATNLGPVFDSKTDLMWVGLLWGYLLAVEKQIQNSKTVSEHQLLNQA